MAASSPGGLPDWNSRKCSPRLAHRGRNAHVERLIGSIRRECLDHVIVRSARHLRRMLRAYLDYYHRSRTHLSLGKDAPDGRPTQLRLMESSWNCRQLADYTTAMSGAPPDVDCLR
jgi:Integrase core domain